MIGINGRSLSEKIGCNAAEVLESINLFDIDILVKIARRFIIFPHAI